MFKYLCFVLLVLLVLAGCQQRIEPGSFDTTVWKADPLACQGNRRQLVSQLEVLKPQLYRHSPREVMAVLGRPDAEELREGSQRVFLYYLEPGPQCKNRKAVSAANKVTVRFNALNQVSEVAYSQPIGDLLQQP